MDPVLPPGRAKTRARTLEERWPNEKYPNRPPNFRLAAKNHSRAQNPLPPLASWVFNMVHPDVRRDFEGCAFYDGLKGDTCMVRGGPFRYEFFFLPGVTTEECIQHFRGEMKARGTVWRQYCNVNKARKESGLQEVYYPPGEVIYPPEECVPDEELVKEESLWNQESDHEPEGDAGLPGLGWAKAENGLEYRVNFFTYTDAEIETEGAAGDERNVYKVEFGEECGYDECDDVEAMGEYDPMKHAIRSTRMKIRDEEYIESCLRG
ncbi:hypothetical protein DER46DRAFT_687286 [Fusarium sp. MPI-SDFR-AT-0072]|nr:hypothetical protein DER46DRAFT_687286 [Fusarium sp. MPI-SDFR-AT-0072]